MIRWLVRWVLSVVCLLVVAQVVPGFRVASVGAALIAVVVIGLVNATLGAFLKLVTLPLRILSLGLFSLVINALMLLLASHFVSGFHVRGFVPAFLGALLLAVLGMIVRLVTP